MRTSYSRNKIQVLLLENIDRRADALFKDNGYQVETVPHSLDESELLERVRNLSIIGYSLKNANEQAYDCGSR